MPEPQESPVPPGWKYTPTLSFEGGILEFRTTGYGDQDGSAVLVMDEADLSYDAKEDSDGYVCRLAIPRSELEAIRDFLNRHLPQDADAALSALRSAGYAVVPVEATVAMCAWGENRAVDYDCAPADENANEAMRAIWRAMVNAAQGERG